MVSKAAVEKLAVDLLADSGFARLTREQSWKPAVHLSLLQMQQYRVSTELFNLVSLMETAECTHSTNV